MLVRTLTLLLLAVLSRAAPGAAETLTFPAVADTYVDGGAPAATLGTSTILKADASPVRIIYLRFALTGVNGRAVQQARLRLVVADTSPASGGAVHRITNSAWDERTLSFATRPPVDGPVLTSLGPVTTLGAVVEFPLEGAVTGDGLIELALDSPSSSGVGYASTTSTTAPGPTLVLTVASGPAVQIVQPPAGSSFFVGDAITFTGTASDPTDGDLSRGIAWRSTLDGPLGTGASITTSLREGPHTITAAVTNQAGAGTTAQVAVTVVPRPAVNTEPLVAITTPLDGRTLVAGPPVHFAGSAHDLEDGDLSATLAWTSDRDGAVGTGAAVDHTLSVGTHGVTASAVDQGGLTGGVTITVVVVPPDTLSFVAVADTSVDGGSPATKYGSNALLRVDASPIRTAYLRFLVQGLAGARVTGARLRLQVDAASQAASPNGGTLSTITSQDWQEATLAFANAPPVDGVPLASVGRVVAGQVVDLDLGNAVTADGPADFALVNTSSDEADYRSRETTTPPVLTLTLAGRAPAVTIITPAVEAVVHAGDQVTLTAAATDLEDGDVTGRIEWASSLDGPLGTGGTVRAAALQVGFHVITGAATDSDGRRGTATITLRVRPPNQPPLVGIVTPAEGARLVAATAVMLSAVVSDDEDTDLAGRVLWSSSRDGALGTGPLHTVVLSEGNHTLTAAVTDSDGATATATTTITVIPTPPVVTITTPTVTIVARGTRVTFSATALDATDGDISSLVRWASDRNGLLGTGATIATAALAAGSHVITATVTDAGGLVGQAQRTLSIDVPPTLTILTPRDGLSILAGTTLQLAATATDQEDGDLGPTVQWTSSGDGALGIGARLVVASLSVGTHVLRAAVTDSIGSGSSAEVTVLVTSATRRFAPVADTYVNASNTLTAYGAATLLIVGTSPHRQAFLRFAPTGIAPLTVTRALLHLTVGSSSSDGTAVGTTVRSLTTHTWPEETTTYSTRPVIDGPTLATGLALVPDQAIDLDVTPAVAGDGPVDLALTSKSDDSVRYLSREATSGAPELVLTLRSRSLAVAILRPERDALVLDTTPVTFFATAFDDADGDLSARLVWTSDRDGVIGQGLTFTTDALSIGPHVVTATVVSDAGVVAAATVRLDVIAAQLAFAPVADTYVDQALPSTNFGNALRLIATGVAATAKTAYLRFAVTGIGSMQVADARLEHHLVRDHDDVLQQARARHRARRPAARGGAG